MHAAALAPFAAVAPLASPAPADAPFGVRLPAARRDADPTERSAALKHLVDSLQRQPGFPAWQGTVRGSQPAADAGAPPDIERAIALMGVDALRRRSARAWLLDSLPRDAAGLLLREDYLRALLAARLARQLCPQVGLQDDSPAVALYQNLGRLVIAAHLPDEALAVRAEVPRSAWPLSGAEQRASRRRLGWSYAQLGMQLARRWAWPDALCAALRREADWPRYAPLQPTEALRCVGQLANELADVLLYVAPDGWEAVSQDLADRAGACTGQTAASLCAALALGRAQLQALAQTVGLPVSQLAAWLQPEARDATPWRAEAAVAVAAAPEPATGWPAPPLDAADPWRTGPAPRTAQALADADPSASAAQGGSALARQLGRLAARLGDALLRPDAPQAVPRQVLQALFNALGARRAVLHLAGSQQAILRPVQVLGEALRPAAGAVWQVDPDGGHDLFSRLCACGTDSAIADACHPALARHLPPAFTRATGARHFLVLPIGARGRRLGMLYLDRADGQPFVLDEAAWQGLRAVRNQAALALL